MTIYKVRRGEEVTDVEGFAALVQMAKEGALQPDDAVFVPASNRWHYARSIRQLREHFAQVEDPPPPPGKVREMTREMRESTPPAPDPTAATHVNEDGERSGGADVVRMRRGRWTPEGKGVQVPVFNYEVDLEPPPAAKPLRMIAVIVFALLLGGGIYVYAQGYTEYLAEQAELVETGSRPAPPRAPVPAPTPSRALSQQDGPRDEPTPAPAATRAAIAGTPAPAPPTPVPLPSFDADGARRRVMSATVTPVTRTDQFAKAVRTDLIKLAVPVRNVKLVAGKGKTKGPVPFDLVFEYSLGDDNSRATHAKHYWMMVAMAGRRTVELRLNLRAVTVKSFRGNKLASSAVLPAELVKGVSNGSKGTDEVLARFPDLAKP